MRVAMFVWQFDQDYPAAGGPPPDDAQLPISYAFVKALDGPDWMSSFDSSPVAIDSPDGARRVHDAYASAGVGMVPWGVGRAPTVESAQLEGARAGAVARAVQGCYMLDLEDGPEYWAGNLDAVLAWLQSFRNAGGTELWLCPDSRAQHLAGIHLSTWLSDTGVTRVWPQVYWPLMQISVAQAFDDCVRPLLAAGVDASRIWPVFPADAPADELARAIETAQAWGLPGWALWRRGVLSAENTTLLQQLPDNGVVNIPTTAEPPAPTTAPTTPADEGAGAADDNSLALAYDHGWSDLREQMINAIGRAPMVNPANPYRA